MEHNNYQIPKTVFNMVDEMFYIFFSIFYIFSNNKFTYIKKNLITSIPVFKFKKVLFVKKKYIFGIKINCNRLLECKQTILKFSHKNLHFQLPNKLIFNKEHFFSKKKIIYRLVTALKFFERKIRICLIVFG